MNLHEQGFVIINDFISPAQCNSILAQMSEFEKIAGTEFSSAANGIRNIDKKLASVNEFLKSREFASKAKPYLTENAQLVRAILFNKSPQANWFVTWHQDKTVAVSHRFDDKNWRAWSVKDNVLHVQPPLSVLADMVTIRVHLDAAPKENGCLKIIPNSHKLGILSPEQTLSVIADAKTYYCEMQKYAALVMRPLLLHASSKSALPANRRVLHCEFSNWQLPAGINWG